MVALAMAGCGLGSSCENCGRLLTVSSDEAGVTTTAVELPFASASSSVPPPPPAVALPPAPRTVEVAAPEEEADEAPTGGVTIVRHGTVIELLADGGSYQTHGPVDSTALPVAAVDPADAPPVAIAEPPPPPPGPLQSTPSTQEYVLVPLEPLLPSSPPPAPTVNIAPSTPRSITYPPMRIPGR